MRVNDWIHFMAGTFILIGLILGTWMNPLWYLVATFTGLNLLQFGFTRFCPMAVVLKRVGIKE